MVNAQQLGYASNWSFLKSAPAGTIAGLRRAEINPTRELDHNNRIYKHTDGMWYFYYSPENTPADWQNVADISTWEDWEVFDIALPGGNPPGIISEVPTTPAQNAAIVANIRRLMDVFAETVSGGSEPEPSDVFWMEKITTAVENGINLKGWSTPQ